MTGHGDIPMSVMAMKAGAVDFLSKPFRQQEMLDAVTVAIERDRKRPKDDNGLWDVALRLTALIEGGGSAHRLYVEALGVLMAHELIRPHSGEPAAKPQIRGGLAAWQERTVVAYIEDPSPSRSRSPRSLNKPGCVRIAFKQSFGVPPHRFHARQPERQGGKLSTR
jgi:AraC family transcriptional regulator